MNIEPLEQYEIDFAREVNRQFNQWVRNKDIQISSHRGSNLYSAIIEDFLQIDTLEVQEIFEKRYKSLLTYYFHDNYQKDKAIIFIVFLIHLVLEENLTLFYPRQEPTGKHYGHWANLFPKNEILGQILTKRLQYAHGRENITDWYYEGYMKLKASEVKEIFRMSTIRVKKPKQIEEPTKSEDFTVKNVLQYLVGGSIAAILMSAIAQYERLLQIWKPDESSSQTMLSIGYAPGSLKVYGFCLEKTKLCPSDENYYTPLYPSEVDNEQLASTCGRIPEFLKLFVSLSQSTDPKLIELARKNDGDKIWHALQNFLWLITQPYQKSSNKVNVWQDFTEMLALPDLSEIEKLLHNNKDKNRVIKIEHKRDPDMVLLVGKCLEIMHAEGIGVHPQNQELLKDLVEKAL
ncbi:MAG: hypothetical protein KJZ77_18145 [Anaerolineales bacterium]|nr:hypothetical protein [Anaerolineales bacterium]